MDTTAEENATLAREYFEGAMNDNVVDEAALSDDYVAYLGTHGVATADDIRANLARSHEAFPDMAVDIEDVVATGGTVVLRWRLTATHEGPFLGIEPTGEAVERADFIQFAVEDGEIVEAWNLSDRFALFEQLGAIDPSGA